MSIKGHFMPCNDKKGMVWGISRLHGLVERGGDKRFGGEGECLWCVEWKYMMYCLSLCKLKYVFPCANVISIQGHGREDIVVS